LAESAVMASLETGSASYAGLWLFRITSVGTAADTEEASGPRLPEGRLRHHQAGMTPKALDATHQSQLLDFDKLVEQNTRELVERIELKLLEDREEADCSGDTAPTARAFHTCLSLAQRLAPHVALAPRLKSGAFTEDNGGVSLVLQSLVTDRRLNCRIAPDGVAVSAIRIDERMRASSAPVALNDPNVPKELAEWVTSRV